MTIKLTLKSGALLVAALLVMVAGIAYGVTVISRGVEGFVRVTADISVDEALALYQASGDQRGAPLTRIDFGTVGLDPFGNLTRGSVVTLWAENGSGSVYKLSIDDQATGDGAIDTFPIGEVLFARSGEPLSTMPAPDIVLSPGQFVLIDLGLEFTEVATGDYTFTVRFQAEEGAQGGLVVTKTEDTNDGVCDADCSLREAVSAANTGDSILIPAGIYTLTLGSELSVGKDLTLIDSGATDTIIQAAASSADATSRVFLITTGNVSISDVTIRHGRSSGNGGGIRNDGTLTLTNSVVSGNTANVSSGGGLANFGTLTLADSTISGNSANSGAHSGGGISNDGQMTIISSTIDHNMASNIGGGIVNNGTGGLNLINSTVSGNSRGGIYNEGAVVLTNGTVSANTTFGVGNNVGGTLTLTNSIIGSCWDLSGIISHGYNLGASCGFNVTGDLPGVNPLLGPLQDNGGPTFTHALLPGSPAIDHIPVENCEVATDQRGVARPQGARRDIGAYELKP